MSISFTPKTEEELNSQRFIPEGVYPFEVKSAVDKISQAGNPMIELELLIYLPDGRSRQLRDWLMAKMEFKLFHFCSYTGLGPKYQKGGFDSSDCIGRQGYVKVGLKKDKSGNEIKDYVRGPEMKKSTSDQPKPQPTENEMANIKQGAPDEDVPF